ncbi:hypothetical protein [Streptomyces sp. B21-101]|uniref:hypothetical protein n=1 Tax=Streptomyces sp. B21-101 TaxID=3039415 RepID=UPI002FF3FEA7
MSGASFASGIQLATGVHREPTHAVAQVLAVHVPPRYRGETVESIRDGMRQMAESLGLGLPYEHPPRVARCIDLRRGTPSLSYDGGALMLPIGPEWRVVAERGGPIRILFLFDPLPALGLKEAIDGHVRDCFASGAMRWGTTYLQVPGVPVK